MTGITRNISQLLPLIDPDNQPAPGITGWAWEIIARADASTDDQGVIGVAFLPTAPYTTPYPLYKLVTAEEWEHMAPFYNRATLDTLIWLTHLAEQALQAGIETSPSPSNLIFTPRYSVNYPGADIAIQRLWDNKVNIFRGREKATVKGGDLPSMDNSAAAQMIAAQLRARYTELAERIIQPHHRSTDPNMPLFADARHIAAAAAALDSNPYDNFAKVSSVIFDIGTIRTTEQRAALAVLVQECAWHAEHVQTAYETVLNNVRRACQHACITPIEASTPAELTNKLAAFFKD